MTDQPRPDSRSRVAFQRDDGGREQASVTFGNDFLRVLGLSDDPTGVLRVMAAPDGAVSATVVVDDRQVNVSRVFVSRHSATATFQRCNNVGRVLETTTFTLDPEVAREFQRAMLDARADGHLDSHEICDLGNRMADAFRTATVESVRRG